MSTFASNFSLVMVTGGGLILVSWLGGGVELVPRVGNGGAPGDQELPPNSCNSLTV